MMETNQTPTLVLSRKSQLRFPVYPPATRLYAPSVVLETTCIIAAMT